MLSYASGRKSRRDGGVETNIQVSSLSSLCKGVGSIDWNESVDSRQFIRTAFIINGRPTMLHCPGITSDHPADINQPPKLKRALKKWHNPDHKLFSVWGFHENIKSLKEYKRLLQDPVLDVPEDTSFGVRTESLLQEMEQQRGIWDRYPIRAVSIPVPWCYALVHNQCKVVQMPFAVTAESWLAVRVQPYHSEHEVVSALDGVRRHWPTCPERASMRYWSVIGMIKIKESIDTSVPGIKTEDGLAVVPKLAAAHDPVWPELMIEKPTLGRFRWLIEDAFSINATQCVERLKRDDPRWISMHVHHLTIATYLRNMLHQKSRETEGIMKRKKFELRNLHGPKDKIPGWDPSTLLNPKPYDYNVPPIPKEQCEITTTVEKNPPVLTTAILEVVADDLAEFSLPEATECLISVELSELSSDDENEEFDPEDKYLESLFRLHNDVENSSTIVKVEGAEASDKTGLSENASVVAWQHGFKKIVPRLATAKKPKQKLQNDKVSDLPFDGGFDDLPLLVVQSPSLKEADLVSVKNEYPAIPSNMKVLSLPPPVNWNLPSHGFATILKKEIKEPDEAVHKKRVTLLSFPLPTNCDLPCKEINSIRIGNNHGHDKQKPYPLETVTLPLGAINKPSLPASDVYFYEPVLQNGGSIAGDPARSETDLSVDAMEVKPELEKFDLHSDTCDFELWHDIADVKPEYDNQPEPDEFDLKSGPDFHEGGLSEIKGDNAVAKEKWENHVNLLGVTARDDSLSESDTISLTSLSSSDDESLKKRKIMRWTSSGEEVVNGDKYKNDTWLKPGAYEIIKNPKLEVPWPVTTTNFEIGLTKPLNFVAEPDKLVNAYPKDNIIQPGFRKSTRSWKKFPKKENDVVSNAQKLELSTPHEKGSEFEETEIQENWSSICNFSEGGIQPTTDEKDISSRNIDVFKKFPLEINKLSDSYFNQWFTKESNMRKIGKVVKGKRKYLRDKTVLDG
jgi:hypothetical protein